MERDRCSLDEQALRLFLARWLRQRVTASVRGVIPPDASRRRLESLAETARRGFEKAAVPAGVSFEPRYPGRIEKDAAATTARLVLTCRAQRASGPLGVVFTVLIAGRRPEVSIAPPGANIDKPHVD